MTERQIRLKDEIMRIADQLQLGIFENEKDWFFQFIQKMDYGVYIDSYRDNYTGWHKISYGSMNDLSLDFIMEFINKLDWRQIWLKNKNKFSIDEMLRLIETPFIMTWDWYILKKIGKSDQLTDELVIKYEKLFDQTCESRRRNGAPGGSDFTAWYYIANNQKLSPHIREMAAKKMQYNGRKPNITKTECCSNKSFFEKIFCS